MEEELLKIVLESEDPKQAAEIAISIILPFLGRSESD